RAAADGAGVAVLRLPALLPRRGPLRRTGHGALDRGAGDRPAARRRLRGGGLARTRDAVRLRAGGARRLPDDGDPELDRADAARRPAARPAGGPVAGGAAVDARGRLGGRAGRGG